MTPECRESAFYFQHLVPERNRISPLLLQCSNDFCCTDRQRTYTKEVMRKEVPMDLTRPLNVVLVCAAFVFVGALVFGIL